MSELKCINPSTNEVISTLEKDNQNQIQDKVKNAHTALKSWRKVSLDDKMEMLNKAHIELAENVDKLAKIIHEEMGKPLAMAVGEVKACTNIEEELKGLKTAYEPEVITSGKLETTRFRDPLGVNACITPWNFPILMAKQLLVPALMAGNTVLFKPSEETSLIGLAYFEILNKHLPENVIQLVIGDGEQGRYLVESDVQLITFVGSKATGAKILESGSPDLKRVLLELGGKDPLIVLNTADLEKAVPFAVNNSFRNSGQVCVSTEKIILDESIADDFTQKMIEATKSFEIGPMIHKRQKDLVVSQVKDALSKGANLLFGEVDETESNFLSPLILNNITADMDIFRNETFGPVACIMNFKDHDHAISMANDTEYGLGAVVFGAINDETKSVARQLGAGMIGINKSCGGIAGSAWVGAGQSGYGFHSSLEGHRQFTQLRQVTF
jgi:acyl-CoA reductase-like NAD-dependent aldehyde dehydrogenase